jgi:hypothetical protein
MEGRLRSRRLPVVVLLLVCAATPGLEAQQFVCWPIAPGDTASDLALRLTSDPAAAYSHAFQIRDPARQMFVPKSHYRRLHATWQACVATGPLGATPLATSPIVAVAAPAIGPVEPPLSSAAPPAASPARVVLARADGVVLIATMAALVLTLLVVVVVGATRPRPVPPVMRRAGEEFLRVFARPLVDPSSGVPPIHARLRFVRRTAQLEIFIAPGAGRRYPNLADHKTNVQYDVDRVLRVLGRRFVMSDRLRAEGRWLVVPIRAAGQDRTGVK